MEPEKVLSEEKQLILATFYKYGIEGISFDNDRLYFYKNGGFAGNLHFSDEPFNFTEILEYMQLKKTYSLESIIENFCSLYKHILK